MNEQLTDMREVQCHRNLLKCVAAHAEASYPQECFGFLLGHFGDRCIRAIRPGRNVNVSRPHDRYEMDPREFLQAQKEAERWGGEVIGFYHSHPDGRAVPSAYDCERAWPEYLYLIVSISAGRAGEVRLWRLEDLEGDFQVVALQIKG